MDSQCAKWGEKTREECAQYRDQGYNDCAQYRDQGYNDCAQWGSECCDWWPCSWVCEVITWFCVAWYWVSNIVCVAWYWVSNIVCVAWTYVTEAVCLIWVVVTIVVAFVVEVISATIGVILDGLAFIVDLIFSIPIIGAFLKELWSVFTDIVWRIVGLVDAIAWFVGIRPEKKLRVFVIMLRDEKGNLVADKDMVAQELNRMIEIYKEEANVRVIQLQYFNATTPFSDNEIASADWITEASKEESEGILDLNCGAGAIGEDYWTQGTKFNWLMAKYGFWGNGRRLLGYGCPIGIFIVRSINGPSGCSLNMLSNYVCVVGAEIKDKTTIAHECGHACGLWDVDEPQTNLMYKNIAANTDELTNFQAGVLRNSKHVTYF